jgi:general secretion pathway protein A
MFERHFGLRENPFHSGHQMRFLYPSREHQEARAHLRYGIENREPFVLITGEVGTGKTTALYDALAEWGSKVSVALVTNSALTREEMIEEISLRFGLPLPPGTSKPQALAQLERHLMSVRNRGEHAVLLLDEAQNLAPDLLEEIRLLSNLETQGEKLVQIFLVGQPELEAKLHDPQLRQLRQRISVHYRLNPLSPEETAGYIHHRISVAGGNPWAAFPPEACREVYRVTHGIPREINTVATQAMITAYTEGQNSVTVENVQAVARENEFKSVLGAPVTLPDRDIPMPAAPQPGNEEPAPPSSEPAHLAAPPDAGHVVVVSSAPAWTPPDLEAPAAAHLYGAATPLSPASPSSGPSRVEPVQREELDAWSLAARDLMEARRKNATLGDAAAVAAADAAPHDEPRFPTPAELEARAADADPHNTDLTGLPARLRQKIEDDIARDERGGHRTPVALAAVAAAAIALGLVLAQRFQVIDLPFLRPIVGVAQEGKPTPAPTTEPVAPPVAAAPARDTTASAADPSAAAHDTGHAAVAPASKPVTTPAPAAPPSVATKPVSPTPASAKPTTVIGPVTTPKPVTATPAAKPDTLVFGISVAAYLDRDRAVQERDKLAARTGLAGVVMPFNNAGTTMYRVVLGHYTSNGAATRAASDFVAKYGVNEAQPVLVSRSKAR